MIMFHYKCASSITIQNTLHKPQKNPETLPHKDNIPGLYSFKETKKFITQTALPIQSQTNKLAAARFQQLF